jgi:hypothetical protein
MNDELDENDHINMAAYFGFLLDAHKVGALPKDKTVCLLTEVVRELDAGNYDDVRLTFEQGRKLMLDEGAAHFASLARMMQERARSTRAAGE